MQAVAQSDMPERRERRCYVRMEGTVMLEGLYATVNLGPHFT